MFFIFTDWTGAKEANPWEDNWDNDIAEEDFSVQLKQVKLIISCKFKVI